MAAMAQPLSLQLLIQLFLLTLIACLDVHGAAKTQLSTFSPPEVASEGSSGTLGVALLHMDRESAVAFRVLGEEEKAYGRLVEAVKRSNKRAALFAARLKAVNVSTTEMVLPLAYDRNQGYLMEVHLGTPSQKFQVIADTGSELGWVGCKQRKVKGVVLPSLDPNKSSSYKAIPRDSPNCQALHSLGDNFTCITGTCCFRYTYGDGSMLSGKFATEALTLMALDGSPRVFLGIAFGCAHHLSGMRGIQGIMGLARSRISLPGQLSNSNIPYRFSLCLLSFHSGSNLKSSLRFGTAPTLQGPGVLTTPYVFKEQTQIAVLYWLNLQAISIGNVKVTMPPQTNSQDGNGTVIDSGTDITLVDPSVFHSLAKAFKAATSDLPHVEGSEVGLHLCVNLSAHENYKFPSFTLHFQDADMPLPGDNYLYHLAQKITCLNLASSGVGGFSIIGSINQQNFEILYDNVESTLSFVPRDCSKASYSSP